MASSSSSYHQNVGFSGIEPAGKRRPVSESSRLFEVFINHRGPDVKQTLALQLYNSLQESGIKAFLDKEEKEPGDSFPSTLETAIRSASVHIAIFSKSYAESAWCLIELVLMLQTQAKIFPVFYGVQPSELRHVEKGVYAAAFTNYKNKSRHLEKLEEWKEALQTVSNITGWEFSESDVFDCKEIVSAVEKEVKRTKSLYVAKYPVALNNLVQDFERRTIHDQDFERRTIHDLVQDFERRTIHDLVQDFERKCMLNKNAEQKAKAKARAGAVGIFGMGGIGKTTLSKELFNRMGAEYIKKCFLFDVREASAKGQLPSLQVQLIKDLFNEQNPPNFKSIEEGTCYIKDCLERSRFLSSKMSFLLIVDDIDHVHQLDALLFRDILNKSSDSLLIITTRDLGVLISTGINTRYEMKGMNTNDARELFCWHAFEQPYPATHYERVVNDFINVCGGLPLSLQVLGRHVRGRDLTYWSLELDKFRKILPRDIKESLKISFDALEPKEKQIFMDIACFFIYKREDMAITIWKGCGWNAQHALHTLKDKCFINEIEDWRYKGQFRFGMHDHLRDLGRAMTKEMSGPRRLWRPQELEYLELKGFQTILAQTNVRCFQRILDRALNVYIKYFIGNSEDWSETSASLLWLTIGSHWELNQMTSIPSWIPLKNLRGLKIKTLNRLSLSDEQVPSSLKEFPGICDLTNLVQLKIHGCPQLEELPCLFHLSSLESVSICECFKLNGLQLDGCNKLRRVKVFRVPKLAIFNIRHCPQLEELTDFSYQDSIKRITIDGCGKLNRLNLHCCPNLKTLSGNVNVAKLNIVECPKFEELSSLVDVEELAIKECKNAAIPNFIHRFQRVPSKSLFVISTKSIFSEDHFSDCIGMKAHVIPIGSYVESARALAGALAFESAWQPAWTSEWEPAWTSVWASACRSAWASAWASERGSLSAIIICGLGSKYYGYQKLITIVITNQELIDDYEGLGRHMADYRLYNYYSDTMEEAYMVMVKKSEEWRTISVMKIITDQLFKK